jgi:quercetin dioxygenase-like cupin family protein
MNFDSIPEVTIPHMKGGEGYAKVRLMDDGRVKMMKAILDPGCSIGLHTHEDSFETVYVLEGELVAYLNGAKEIVKAGQIHYCPKGSSHTMKNEGKIPAVSINIVGKE